MNATAEACDVRFHVADVLVKKHVARRYIRAGRFTGYAPTINVKSYGDLTDAQFQDVRSELPGKHRRWFTRKYLESADPDYEHFNAAAELAWDRAKEDAQAIFGCGVDVFSDGRSGGWLVVTGLPSLEEEPEEWTCARESLHWPSDSEGWNHNGIELTKTDSLLHRWRYFCACAEAEVADLPRAHAWEIAFNQYLPEREEKEEQRRAG